VFAAPKSPSRLRCLSWRCLMVMRSSSLERRCLSSIRRSAVGRLATGTRGAISVCTTNGAHAAISVRECTANGSGVPLEWLAHHPPWSGVLMAVMMSWSMSWCHCSAVDGEAPGLGGGCRGEHALLPSCPQDRHRAVSRPP
jgi:hypothetical protein